MNVLSLFGLIATVVALGFCQSTVAAETSTAPARKVDFSRDIRPILSNHCWSCHGPDEQHRKAGLRLDIADAARAKLESGLVAIVAGKPVESELIARIESADEAEMMPPPVSKKPLTAEQKKLLKMWI